MSTKYPQGIITGTPPYAQGNFSGVWTLEQLAKNYYFYGDGIANSLRFRSSASAYLSRTSTSSLTSAYKWTYSFWVKRGQLGGSAQMIFCGPSGPNGNYVAQCFFTSTNTLLFEEAGSSYGGNGGYFETTQVFRDPGAWYHIVITEDSTSPYIRLYVNGSQVTTFSTYTAPSLNGATKVQVASANQYICTYTGTTNFHDCYLADINFIDGQALDPSYFGVTATATGVWSPKKYTGTYGTNGFHLNFSNGTSTTTLGYDSSGNSNNWTTNNISLTSGSTYDWMIDSPTSFAGSSYGVGNYAVLNPLNKIGSNITITNGNLSSSNGSTSHQAAFSSIALPTSGSFYAEFYPTSSSLSGGLGFGFANIALPTLGGTGEWSAYWNASLNLFVNGVQTAYGTQNISSGDVIKLAFNSSNGYAWVGLNSNWIDSSGGTTGNPATNTNPTFTISVSGFNLAFLVREYATSANANFGQQPFSYTPPSGYKSLCTYNLPTPTVPNGANYMAATLYTGNGATQSISNAVNGVIFQPDLVWLKDRSNAYNHALQDSVRGALKVLSSSVTDAEYTETNGMNAFLSNGFSFNGDGYYRVNTNGNTFVGWQWKAGGTAVTNTSGSITSSVSANTTAGFSVVTYTGTGSAATVGHGLGVAPSFIINKGRSNVSGWNVYHSALGGTQYILLESTQAAATNSYVFNNTNPTSTVFSAGSYISGSSVTYVTYCFAAIAGYSAFGSYTGNGSADGTFVYCGFRPRWIMVKSSSNSYSWFIYDSARDTYNVAQNFLIANGSQAEAQDVGVDLLSNGFKWRGSDPSFNGSGYTYIYAAFAENPFAYALAR